MMKHEFYYTSRDSVTKIHAIEWLPDREIKGVLQICHGMVEYIDRYDEFAEFMSEHGYYVVGHDHLGHGKSIQTEIDLGYFDERKGNQYVIGDISIRNLNRARHRRNGSHPTRRKEMNMCGIRCVPIHLHWEPIIRCLPV